MRHTIYRSHTYTIPAETLAIQVLQTLTQAHGLASQVSFDDLVQACAAPPEDVQAVLAALDEEGFVHADELRVTLAGFAIGLKRRSYALRTAA